MWAMVQHECEFVAVCKSEDSQIFEIEFSLC